MKLPEIRIQFAWLLADGPSKILAEKIAEPGTKQPSFEDYEKWTADYRKAWQGVGDKVLAGVCEMLDLQFYKPVIDVSLAPWFRATSDPLIMNFLNEPDQFVDVLAHELFHVLLTDNTKLTIQNKASGEVDLLGLWKSLFGNEYNFHTLAHIPVHAASKYMYLDVLKEPSRLKRNIDDDAELADYKAAWDYIEAHDYKDILTNLKQSYNAYESTKKQ